MWGICKFGFVDTLFLWYLNKHFAYISHHKQCIKRKMPYFFKRLSANKFVSSHPFDNLVLCTWARNTVVAF